MAGEINPTASSEGTSVVNLNEGTFACTRLTGRVFPVVKPRNSMPGPISVGAHIGKRHRHPRVFGFEETLHYFPGERRISAHRHGSTNGTIVDGVSLVPQKPRRLMGGETISLGRLMLVFYFAEGFIRTCKPCDPLSPSTFVSPDPLPSPSPARRAL